MADSVREAALKALKALLDGIAWTGAPAPAVRRNEAEEAIPAGGLVNLRDGDPGEPEVYLSPARYAYSHRAEVAVLVQGAQAEGRDAAFDSILRDIGAALAADPTLGGAVEMALPAAPEPDLEKEEGAATLKVAVVPVFLEYLSDTPLG